jgi:hypothetical protein
MFVHYANSSAAEIHFEQFHQHWLTENLHRNVSSGPPDSTEEMMC